MALDTDDRPPADALDGQGVGSLRVAVHYAVLLALVAAVVVTSVTLGAKRKAEPAIAGGYAVSAGAACLGPELDIAQSGRYVDVSNPQSTVSGALIFDHGRLSGTIHCRTGSPQAIDATVASDGLLAGTLGGHPVQAIQKSAPPAPASPKPLAPSSVDGSYSLAPASTCLGGSFVLREKGDAVRLL